jgi:hypothetical protein
VSRHHKACNRPHSYFEDAGKVEIEFGKRAWAARTVGKASNGRGAVICRGRSRSPALALLHYNIGFVGQRTAKIPMRFDKIEGNLEMAHDNIPRVPIDRRGSCS